MRSSFLNLADGAKQLVVGGGPDHQPLQQQHGVGVAVAGVDIELEGGEMAAATVTNESIETLGLRPGQPATAVFKAGSVILAVAD